MDDAVRRLTDAGLRPPETVTLVMTNRCNLNCRHCWPESLPDAEAPFIETAVLGRLIREFAEMGAETLILTGGEPLLHPDWFHVLSVAADGGIGTVILQTNAILITETEIGLMKRLASHRIFFQISLDGATAAHHEYVRGPLSFERTLEGLRRLRDAGLGDRIFLAFTEMWHNFEDIPDALAMAYQLGVRRFATHSLVQGGRAGRTDQLAPPTADQYRRLLKRYGEDDAFRDRYLRLGRIAALEWLKGRSEPSASCCTCIQSPYVTARGMLYPCVMLHADEYAAENLHERPLAEAVREMIPRWRELEKIRRRRAASIPDCEGCPGRRHCAAGCMGRAYERYGRLMAVEDRCALRQAVYGWRPEADATGRSEPPGG